MKTLKITIEGPADVSTNVIAARLAEMFAPNVPVSVSGEGIIPGDISRYRSRNLVLPEGLSVEILVETEK